MADGVFAAYTREQYDFLATQISRLRYMNIGGLLI